MSVEVKPLHDPVLQEALDNEFRRQGARLADYLRSYANRIEGISKGPLYSVGRSRHVGVSTDIISELRAMQGNMTMLEQLVESAGEAQHEAEKR